MQKIIPFIITLFVITNSTLTFGQSLSDLEDKQVQRKITKLTTLSPDNFVKNKNSTEMNGNFYEPITNLSNISFIYIGHVNTCQKGGFDYLIVFNEAIEIITVSILTYDSNYGYEICNKTWLNQFIGISSNNIDQSINNIDAISGATVSVECIKNDIKQITHRATNL